MLSFAWAKQILHFFREVFSDGGQGSASRVLSAVVVVSVVGWVWYLVWETKRMPDLSGPSLFLGSGTGATYGVNKASDIVSAFKGNQPGLLSTPTGGK